MTQHVHAIMQPKVRAAAPDAKLAAIAQTMKEFDIGSVPIVDKGKVVGVITDRDIALRAFTGGKDPTSLQAKDVMTGSVASCLDTDSVSHAIHLMETRKIRRLPVLDKNAALVGMLSLGDASAALSNEQCGRLVKAVSAHHG